jgi:hypothetical protein
MARAIFCLEVGAAAAGEAGTPVPGRFRLFEPVELADFLEALVDDLPGTAPETPSLEDTSPKVVDRPPQLIRPRSSGDVVAHHTAKSVRFHRWKRLRL